MKNMMWVNDGCVAAVVLFVLLMAAARLPSTDSAMVAYYPFDGTYACACSLSRGSSDLGPWIATQVTNFIISLYVFGPCLAGDLTGVSGYCQTTPPRTLCCCVAAVVASVRLPPTSALHFISCCLRSDWPLGFNRAFERFEMKRTCAPPPICVPVAYVVMVCLAFQRTVYAVGTGSSGSATFSTGSFKFGSSLDLTGSNYVSALSLSPCRVSPDLTRRSRRSCAALQT
jgi:hypothetical protein